MELVINDKTYSFNFGMRFLKDINKKIETPIDFGSSIKQQIGLQYYVSLLLDEDVEALSMVLLTANAGQNLILHQLLSRIISMIQKLTLMICLNV